MRPLKGSFGRVFKIFMTTALLVPALAISAMAQYTITDLGTLGGSYSIGYGINNSGEVTGFIYTAGNPHAFLYTPGVGMQDLGTLSGGSQILGAGINNSGQVTGNGDVDGLGGYAFLYTPGTGMQDLGALPGGSSSHGCGINDSGQVTGLSSILTGGAEHAFLYTPGTGMQDLGTLPGDSNSEV